MVKYSRILLQLSCMTRQFDQRTEHQDISPTLISQYLITLENTLFQPVFVLYLHCMCKPHGWSKQIFSPILRSVLSHFVIDTALHCYYCRHKLLNQVYPQARFHSFKNSTKVANLSSRTVRIKQTWNDLRSMNDHCGQICWVCNTKLPLAMGHVC